MRGRPYPLCARQSSGATPSRRETCGSAMGRETTVDTGLCPCCGKRSPPRSFLASVFGAGRDGQHGPHAQVRIVRGSVPPPGKFVVHA